MPRVLSVGTVTVAAMTTTATARATALAFPVWRPRRPGPQVVAAAAERAARLGVWSVWWYRPDSLDDGVPSSVMEMASRSGRRGKLVGPNNFEAANAVARTMADRAGGRTEVRRPDGRTVVAVYTSTPPQEDG